MGFFKRMMGGGNRLDGAKLATSPLSAYYAQIDLLSYFVTAQPLHTRGVRQRYSRAAPILR